MRESGATFIVRIKPEADAIGMRVEIGDPGETRFLTCDPALLVIHVWNEDADVVRTSIRHPSSGTVAMLQGNAALGKLARRLHVKPGS